MLKADAKRRRARYLNNRHGEERVLLPPINGKPAEPGLAVKKIKIRQLKDAPSHPGLNN